MMRVLTMMALTAVAMAAAACGEPAKKAPPPPADANFTFKGSYAKSCRDVTTVENGYLKAECAGVDGFVPTKIQASLCQGDIGNNNGVLVCNGATAVAPNAPNTPAPAPAPAKASPAAKAPAAKDPAAKADKTPPETPAAPKAGAKVTPAA